MEYYHKALEIWLATLGDNHPNLATCYNNIGYVYDSQGEYDKALNNYNKALDILLNIVGNQHPNVASIYSNMGYVYRVMENYDRALECFEKALDIVTKGTDIKKILTIKVAIKKIEEEKAKQQ